MKRTKRIIWTVIAVLLVVFCVWARGRILSRDTSLHYSENPVCAPSVWNDLEGRMLAWSTTANVPIEIEFGGYGYGLLEVMGVPEMLRGRDLTIGRNPVRDEMNVAVMKLTRNGEGEVRFLTEQDGTYTYAGISADSRYVVATREEDNTQNIGRWELSTGEREPVAFSHSYDRWPSCDRYGNKILFHSYRDGNPSGDLYLAMKQDEEDWRITRLTDSPEREHVWPRIAADGNYIVAVERNIGADAGRIIRWHLDTETLGEPVYITDELGDYRFPSINGDGSIVCWQGTADGSLDWRLWLKTEGGEVHMIAPPDSEGNEWLDMVQPSLTADGRYIVFNENNRMPGRDRIGIYDVQEEKYIFLEGCEGSVMMPSLSDQPDSGEEQ